MVVQLMKYINLIFRIFQIISGNSFVRKRILEKNPGTFTEKRRNFDILVIGEKYDVKDLIPDNKTYLQFDAPDRTLFASALLLQGKFSWLNEGQGKCIIICKRSNENRMTTSILDIPFLHAIIISKYKLKKQQTELKYPLISHPLLVFKFLFGKKYNMSSIEKCPFPEIVDFCEQRDIELEYRVIN